MKANGKDGLIVLHEAVWEDDKCLVHLLVSRRRIRRGLFLPRINLIKCSKSRMSCYKSLMKRALCVADMRKSLRKSYGALVECHRLWQLVRSLDASQFAVRLSTATCQPVSSSSFMIGGGRPPCNRIDSCCFSSAPLRDVLLDKPYGSLLSSPSIIGRAIYLIWAA